MSLITNLENDIKFALDRFPGMKKIIKRIYQLSWCTITNSWETKEGEFKKITPADGYEYIGGYYDKAPWDSTDRYLISLRVKDAHSAPASTTPGVICVIDTQTGMLTEIGETSAWNVQQGCMAQWLGPDYGTRIIYNDYRNGKYCSVIYNWDKRTEEKVLGRPIYDVAPNGEFALSLDFSRLHRLRPGYGYANIYDCSEGVLCPDDYCVWKINIDTGESVGLISYIDFNNFEHKDTMDGAEHKVNHIMISPDSKRFMILHRWLKNNIKKTRLLTIGIDGCDWYNLSDDDYVSHCYWKDNTTILSFLRKKETGDHYYLLKDKSSNFRLLWEELRTDGHCSYSVDHSMVVTDTYPDRSRTSKVYLCVENGYKILAKVFSSFKYDNQCRCDLHPRWNRKGDAICFDSSHEGIRAIYIIDNVEF